MLVIMSDTVYSVSYKLVVKEENESVTYSLIPVIEVIEKSV